MADDAMSHPLGKDTSSRENGHYEPGHTTRRLSENCTEFSSRQLTKDAEAYCSEQEPKVFSSLKDSQDNGEVSENPGRLRDRQVCCNVPTVAIVAPKPLLFGSSLGKHRPATKSLLLPDHAMPEEKSSDVSTKGDGESEPEATVNVFGRACSSSDGLLEGAARMLGTPRHDLLENDGTPMLRPGSREDPPICLEDQTAPGTLQELATCGTAQESRAFAFLGVISTLQPATYDAEGVPAVVNEPSSSQSTSSRLRRSMETTQSSPEGERPEQQDGRPNPVRWQEAAAFFEFFVAFDGELEMLLNCVYTIGASLCIAHDLCEYMDFYSAVLVLLIICHRFVFFL